MIFGTRQKVKKCKDVKSSTGGGGGVSLQVVPTYKYLGFTLDSTLSLNSHVSNVTKMVAYKINLLAKIRKYQSNLLVDDVISSRYLLISYCHGLEATHTPSVQTCLSNFVITLCIIHYMLFISLHFLH